MWPLYLVFPLPSWFVCMLCVPLPFFPTLHYHMPSPPKPRWGWAFRGTWVLLPLCATFPSLPAPSVCPCDQGGCALGACLPFPLTLPPSRTFLVWLLPSDYSLCCLAAETQPLPTLPCLPATHATTPAYALLTLHLCSLPNLAPSLALPACAPNCICWALPLLLLGLLPGRQGVVACLPVRPALPAFALPLLPHARTVVEVLYSSHLPACPSHLSSVPATLPPTLAYCCLPTLAW